jgi:hypothetical protein
VATKWVSGYFAKYEIGRNFRGISAEIREILGDRHLPVLLVLAEGGGGGGLGWIKTNQTTP